MGEAKSPFHSVFCRMVDLGLHHVQKMGSHLSETGNFIWTTEVGLVHVVMRSVVQAGAHRRFNREEIIRFTRNM